MGDGSELRALMRRYPSGVSIVGVEVDGQRYAVTMGSLVSLSLEPALVGISVGKQNSLHALVQTAGRFGVSLLAADQRELAVHFARSLPPIALWHGIAVRNAEGPPMLAGALGWLSCTVSAQCDAGDHTLFVGEVDETEAGREGQALVYLQSEYHPV
jgi:flavin reductase (DIM6/NTAB) family NADH-FMN oxidoreductase RutF